jgi:hypothetical protein
LFNERRFLLAAPANSFRIVGWMRNESVALLVPNSSDGLPRLRLVATEPPSNFATHYVAQSGDTGQHKMREGARKEAKTMAKGKTIPALEDLPHSSSVPWCGRVFFGKGKEASYRLAKKGVIPTIPTGTRNMMALPRVLHRRLTTDPQESTP